VIVTRVAQTLTGKERLDGTKPGFVSEGNSDLRSVSDPGELIALIVDTSALQLAGLFGILKASCAYLPIDVTLPEARIDSMLTEADVSTIVVSATILQSMPCLQGRCCIVIDELVDMHQQAGADEINATSLETIKQDQPENSDRLAYVMYTSGSSGRPKGVEITHANLIASTRARMSWYGLTAPRYLLMSSIAFDSSVAGIYWTLLSGGVLIMASPDERGDVDAIERLIRDNEVSHLLCLPSLYELLLRQATHKSLHTVRTAIVAGEACGSSLVSLHHEQLHHADLFNEYGPTSCPHRPCDSRHADLCSGQ